MSKPDRVPYVTTIRVRDTCLCLHVQRAARALARRFDIALRPLDLTSGQFSMLNTMNRPKPAGMAQVSSLLQMDRTTLTAALKPLQRRRLVKVSVNPDDARSRLLSLTDKGHAVLARAVPVWVKTHAELDGLLPERDPNRLRRELDAMC